MKYSGGPDADRTEDDATRALIPIAHSPWTEAGKQDRARLLRYFAHPSLHHHSPSMPAPQSNFDASRLLHHDDCDIIDEYRAVAGSALEYGESSP